MAEKPSEVDTKPAEFELMLRSTERVRVLVQRSCRCCAPSDLRVKIQQTLVLYASSRESFRD